MTGGSARPTDAPRRSPAGDGSRLSLAVVIPTANRAQLAIAACRSVLAQDAVDLEVVVSDNSTVAEEAAALERFCRDAGDGRLTYLRPDAHLAMPTHWDWAIGQVLQRTAASHVMVHYDRKITKPGALRGLWDAAKRFPDQLITYPIDHIINVPAPATLWQTPWTGGLYSVRTARVAELTASASIEAMGHVFPILSNCLVPRAVLLAIRERFGNFCDSTGPDSCFTYRFVALADRFLCSDHVAGIVYASHRSNGLGYLRQSGGDFPSFVADWGERPWLDAAPVPGLNVGQNMLFHEYELVRRAEGPDRFPPIDKARYLAALEAYLWWIADTEIRQRMRAMLEAHGLPRAQDPQTMPAAPRRSWSDRIRHGLANRARSGWYRLVRRPAVLRIAKRAGVAPEHLGGISFGTDERALQFGLRMPRPRQDTHDHLVAMQAERIDTAGLRHTPDADRARDRSHATGSGGEA